MRKLILLFGSIFTLLLSIPAISETLYITDKFSIPVYPDKTNRTTPIKMLTIGASVDIIKREQDFSQIQAGAGLKGWIETKYLSSEKTIQSAYLQLTEQYKLAQQKIQDYETRLLDMQDLRKEAKTADWLRTRLNENDKTESDLQHQIKLKDIEITDIKISYATLLNEVEQLRKASASSTQPASYSESQGTNIYASYNTPSPYYYSTNSAGSFYTWLILSLAVTLIIGILMGFVLIDYKFRKKPGYVKSC